MNAAGDSIPLGARLKRIEDTLYDDDSGLVIQIREIQTTGQTLVRIGYGVCTLLGVVAVFLGMGLR